MKTATLGFAIRNNAVLLGEKKKDATIGSGRLNGAGGKVNIGESIDQCLVRECTEEFGITPTSFEHRATVEFCAGGTLDFLVYVYVISEWHGEEMETIEMHKPTWYPLDAVPFDRMLESDLHWISKVLSGERFTARVDYTSQAEGFEQIVFHPFAPIVEE